MTRVGLSGIALYGTLEYSCIGRDHKETTLLLVRLLPSL